MKKWIWITVGLLAFLFIYFSQPVGLSPDAKVTLAIFALALVLWVTEALPLYITAFVILLLEAVLIPRANPELSYKIFFAPFFSPTIALFLGGFTLAAGLKKYHLDERIAHGILNLVGEKPNAILFGLMASTAFLSMWMSNTATTALMITIALPLIGQLDEGDKFKRALILGIPFAANIGGMATPIGTPPNAIAIGRLRDIGVTVSFFDWVVLATPIMLILLGIMWLLLAIIFPSSQKKLSISVKPTRTDRFGETAAVVILVLTVVLWLTPQSVYKSLIGTKVSSGVIALIPIIAFFGSGLLDKRDFLGLNWDVLVLMGGGLSLGLAMDRTGLAAWIVQSLGLQSLSDYWVFVAFVGITAVLTNFISNTSAAALIVPIALAATRSEPLFVGLGVALAASASMMLPISTPPNAIAYGTGHIRVKDMLLVGTIMTVIAALMVVIFGHWWWNLIVH